MLQLAVAQPHRGRRHVHDHLVKKDDVVVTVVNTVYAQASEVPEVIVWVDQNGVPVSTSTKDFVSVATTAPAVAAAAAAPAENVQVAAAPEVASPVVQSTSSTAPPPATSSSPSSQPSSQPSTPAGNGYGFSYSPYNADHSCKTQDQVNTDFDHIANQGFSLVRIYGVDCNQTATVLSAAKNKGMKVFAGIFSLSNLSGDVQTIASAANGDWSHFHTISVGNELVNSGTASPAAVVAAIGEVRRLLGEHGFPQDGNVVTVDTLVAARANPSLCDASSYCAVNCHPFFDGKTAAADAGNFLQTQIPTLANVLANKNQKIVVTETGWPWKGVTNGAAVPTLENQQKALSSIKQAFTSNPSDVVLFTAFNDMWKTNDAAQYQAEQFWGMGGSYSPSDPASASFAAAA